MPTWLFDQPIAHRGLHAGSERPENSLAAFESAVMAGLPIELDVQLTADDELVVHHDGDLGRTTGLEGMIQSLPLAEITSRTLFGGVHHIPSFDAVLDLVAGRVPLFVEIKTGHDRNRRAQATARYLASYDGPVAVMSFDPFIVTWFRKNAPHLVRGQLSGTLQDVGLNRAERIVHRSLVSNVLSQPHFVAYESAALTPRRAEWIRRSLPLLVWTVRTEEQRDRARKLADNFIFENVRIDGPADRYIETSR